MDVEPDLTIIIPAYFEQAIIGEIVSQVREVVETIDLSTEILVINDGSTDNTAAEAEAAGATVVSHPYNIGNGAAIKTGIRNARGRLLLMMDADGQHPPAHIPDLIQYADQFDMVVGARQKESDSVWYRDVANQVYNLLATYVSGRKIEDLTSGFRVVRTEIARSMIHLLPNTFSYPTTLTLAILRSGYSLKYFPFVAPQRVGKSKIKLLRDGTNFLLIIFKIATLFSPLKIFVPASILTFLLGVGYGAYKVIFLGVRYGPTSANLMITAVLIFLIGLVSEQITNLRFERSG